MSTFHALLSSPRYANTKLSLIDAYVPPPSSLSSALQYSSDPATPVTASVDNSRIIRADYSERAYSHLAAEAIEKWRAGWPWLHDADIGKRKKVHHETGFVLTATTHKASREEVQKGRKYVRESLENVKALKEYQGKGGRRVKVLGSGIEVRRCWREIGDEEWEDGREEGEDWVWGEGGYVNRGSGWADAAGAMEGLREVVAKIIDQREREAGKQEVRWMHGKVERLLFGEPDSLGERRVLGARLGSGEEIKAKLTVIAAGAWSALLMPKELGHRLRATGQVLGYVKLDPEEAGLYRGKPVLMDMTTSMFIMSPPNITGDALGIQQEAILKVARHGYGYENRVKIQDPNSDEILEVFMPPPNFQSLPPEGDRAIRGFLQAIFPSLGTRSWYKTRICNYTDTPSGNFMISYIPGYNSSVFVASGGSGHGFKFAPIIGEKVLAIIEDQTDWSENEARLVKLWAWPEYKDFDKAWKEGSDGSRGGRRGMRWEDEMGGRFRNVD